MEIESRKEKKDFFAIFGLIVFTFLPLGCSSPVVQRDARGMVVPRSNAESSALGSPVKKKMSILSVFNESPFGGEDLAVTGTEELRKELMRTGEFLIDGTPAVMGTSKEVYAGGGFKLVEIAKKAKISGINFILFGRILDARVREKMDEIGIIRETKAFTEAKLEIRIFDVLANKEIYSGVMDGFASDDHYRFYVSDTEEQLAYRQELLRYSVKVAVRKTIPKIMEIAGRLDWTGRVAKVSGTKIYINAGRSSGVQIGDILKVITEGDEIYDPETGALLGVSQGEAKGTLEIVDYFGTDGTIAVLHSGGAVSEGDYVQLY